MQQWIQCDYCLEAHTFAGRRVGLTDNDIELAGRAPRRRQDRGDRGLQPQIIAAPSEVTDEDVQNLRALGWRDEQIVDVVGLVALNLLTGSFNLVAGIRPAVNAA